MSKHITISELLERLVDGQVPMNIFEGMKKRRRKGDPSPAAAVDPVEEPVDEPAQESVPETAVVEPQPVQHVEEPIAAAPVEDAVEDMFADLKKKKKKKAVPVFDDADENAAPLPEPAAAADGEFDFGEKKKKKKKRPDLAEFEELLKNDGGAANEDDAENEFGGAEQMDGSGVAKSHDHGADEKEDGQEAWLGTTRDYTYPELLARVFKIIRQNNPELTGEKKKYTLVPPQVMREGTKKSIFANVVDIARRMRREPDHLIQYLFSELGTSGSIDGSQRLVMKGRFQQKHIENVLKHYIVEYVTCKTCRSGDTILTKENRLFFLQCQSCGSTKSVSAIKTGFMAQATKRSAMRTTA
ncbi:hypothetical protein CcCBS67573_g03279 [Chytriomyces confervae]|uniref:Translation initiation factor IF2/IF5 domain-containing protein n=1 Tax=Chytriomyces confervae TaxID=246404 RepID=A0A507FGH6_9FUNG|nr:hypothetical protein CcCBS67573_g03279 [Chytriomyces confervae]